MDNQSNRPHTPAGQNIRQRGQELLASAEPYLAQAKEQATRVLSEYQPPLYQRVLGMTTAVEVERTAITASIIAARNGADLSDTQIQAIAENTQSLAQSRASVKWCEIIACAGLTYVRRGKKMHPFFLGNTWTRMVGHSVRFCLYYIGVGLFIDTPLQLSANMRHSEMIKRDPRLAGLTIDSSRPQVVDRRDGQLEAYSPGNDNIAKQAAPAWGSETSNASSAQGSYQDNSSYNQPGSQEPSYNSSRSQSYPQYTPPSRTSQQPQSSWDSDPLPNFDDGASPVAPSARNQPQYPEYSQNGNSWARIRQQSSDQSSSNQDSDRWGSDRSSGGSSWGSNSKGTTWGAQTPESAEKSQAQREFDSLIERERRGTDQTQSSWGRR